ncbi:phosphoadenosine phosphosulfate reductase family protein [Aurantimonas sp. A2-1-M11]|uniref:phosphoadenosine phosphosulfate reductase domain-containing protein n=1 Tax=Aurantimonas sp. A2-1-M11 TaxID=3113712 RepID=UPI002F945A85
MNPNRTILGRRLAGLRGQYGVTAFAAAAASGTPQTMMTATETGERVADLPLIVCKNNHKDFVSMTRYRGRFTTTKNRQCTSDLKRDPQDREVRRYLDANPRFRGKVVTCLGLRAQESSGRAKAKPLVEYNREHGVAGREWYVWLPIHAMTLEEVWATIEGAGQKRHYAYDLGMTRLSCCFCIMSSVGDLRIAAKHRPELYREYVELEREIDNTLIMPRKKKGVAEKRFLPEITGISIEERDAA